VAATADAKFGTQKLRNALDERPQLSLGDVTSRVVGVEVEPAGLGRAAVLGL